MNTLMHYGIEPMSLERETALPAPMRATRNNKVSAIDACNRIRETASMMEEYVRRIPVLDEEAHAELVRKLTENILSIRIALESARERCIQ